MINKYAYGFPKNGENEEYNALNEEELDNLQGDYEIKSGYDVVIANQKIIQEVVLRLNESIMNKTPFILENELLAMYRSSLYST